MSRTRLKLTGSELTDLVVQVRASIAYEKLQLGYEAYLQQAVNYFQINEGSEIIAKVKMPEMYDVLLDIDFLSISTCSCGGQELCEHMAAVFCAVYELHGENPEQFMEGFQTEVVEQQAALELKVAKAKQAEEEKALEKLLWELDPKNLQGERTAPNSMIKQPLLAKERSSSKVILQETDPVEAWHSYFQAKYVHHADSPDYDADVEQLVGVLCTAAASWEPIQRGLFEIHARLFALLQLEDRHHMLYQSHLYFIYGNELGEQVYECLDHIAELMSDITIKSMTDSLKRFYEATAYYLEREFYYEPFEFVDVFALYQLFWSKLSGTEALRQGEKERLDAALAKSRFEDDEFDFNIHARAFLDWLEGQDSAARERLDGYETLHVPFLINQLGALCEKKAWSRLHPWLQWLLPYIQEQDGEEIEAYIYLWRELDKARRVEAEFIEMMTALLPHSEYHYSEYLLSKKDYKRWVDLQITADNLPIYLETHDLRSIEKANPGYLLPLYHHGIAYCISKKKRYDYETAVDMLKILKKLYTKQKLDAKWNVYIAHIVKKYSRLRLFKEELNRAKLVPLR